MRTSREIRNDIARCDADLNTFNKMYINYNDYKNNTGLFSQNKIEKHNSINDLVETIQNIENYKNMLLDELYAHTHKLMYVKRYTYKLASLVLTVLTTGHIHNYVG